MLSNDDDQNSNWYVITQKVLNEVDDDDNS